MQVLAAHSPQLPDVCNAWWLQNPLCCGTGPGSGPGCGWVHRRGPSSGLLLNPEKAHFVWCQAQWRNLAAALVLSPDLGAVQVLAVRKSGRFAWVEFSTIQAAHQALQLDGEPLGTGMLKISQSKTPIHTAGWRAPVRLLCCAHCPPAASPPGVPKDLQAGRAHCLQP